MESVPPGRVELPTNGLGNRCSIHSELRGHEGQLNSRHLISHIRLTPHSDNRPAIKKRLRVRFLAVQTAFIGQYTKKFLVRQGFWTLLTPKKSRHEGRLGDVNSGYVWRLELLCSYFMTTSLFVSTKPPARRV